METHFDGVMAFCLGAFGAIIGSAVAGVFSRLWACRDAKREVSATLRGFLLHVKYARSPAMARQELENVKQFLFSYPELLRDNKCHEFFEKWIAASAQTDRLDRAEDGPSALVELKGDVELLSTH